MWIMAVNHSSTEMSINLVEDSTVQSFKDADAILSAATDGGETRKMSDNEYDRFNFAGRISACLRYFPGEITSE